MSEVPSTTDYAKPTIRAGGYRWVVCALLFFGVFINYFDRQILSLIKETLDKEIGWDQFQYGLVNSAFQATYAISLFGFGWFVDRFGTKLSYALSITMWSAAAGLHALVGTFRGFFIARMALGLGEGGGFPTSIKTVALWFPQRERAFATSLFNSGSNIGAMAAPFIVPKILEAYNWHTVFVVAMVAGFVWLVFWWIFYEIPERKRGVNPAELAHIRDGAPVTDDHAEKVPLKHLLSHKEAWGYVAAKTISDPPWWFFLTWLPDFFSKRGLDIKHSAPLLVTTYGIVTVLSIIGGWAPGFLVKHGWSASSARRACLIAAATTALPILVVTQVTNWTAVILIGLAGAAHQAWSANLYSTVSDMFPKRVVGSLTGFGSMCGATYGIFVPSAAGYLLRYFENQGDQTTGYAILFAYCGLSYFVAFGVMSLLAPNFRPVQMKELPVR